MATPHAPLCLHSGLARKQRLSLVQRRPPCCDNSLMLAPRDTQRHFYLARFCGILWSTRRRSGVLRWWGRNQRYILTEQPRVIAFLRPVEKFGSGLTRTVTLVTV